MTTTTRSRTSWSDEGDTGLLFEEAMGDGMDARPSYDQPVIVDELQTMTRQKSLSVGFFGSPGSGKSVSAAMEAVCWMANGGKVISPAKVFGDGKLMSREVKSKLLTFFISPEEMKKETEKDGFERIDFGEIISLSDSVKNALWFFDEYQNLASSQMWNSGLVKVQGQVNAQRRKLKVSNVYTVMQPGWIDGRIRALTDAFVWCRDLANTPSGRRKGMPMGERIGWVVFDNTGTLSGRMPTRQLPLGWPIARKTLYARAYWNMYDTDQTQDIFTLYSKLRVHGQQVDVDPYGIFADKLARQAARFNEQLTEGGDYQDAMDEQEQADFLAFKAQRGASPDELRKDLSRSRRRRQ